MEWVMVTSDAGDVWHCVIDRQATAAVCGEGVKGGRLVSLKSADKCEECQRIHDLPGIKPPDNFAGRYLDDSCQYPNVTDDILPLGTFWEYISTTFLNGFINYVRIIQAALITRYRTHEENIAALKAFTDGSGVHADFSRDFQDDMFILAEDLHHKNRYWFFWFDMDCSDSCIGRFDTSDDKEEVVRVFREYCDERSRDLSESYGGKKHDALWVPVEHIKGWISG